MSAIGLTINNLPCLLPADLELDLIIKCDLFNFDKVEGTTTLGFDLPFNRTNHKAMNYAYRADSIEGVFRDYPAKLYWKNNLYREGFFKLESIDGAYKGVFRTEAGVISQYKDMLLEDLLKDTAPFDVFSIQPALNSGRYYSFPGYETIFQFPYLAKGKEIVNSPWSDKLIYALSIRLNNILEAIASRIGYTLHFRAVSAKNNTTNLRLINLNRIDKLLNDFASERTVSPHQHLPELTLGQFIQSLRLFGIYVDIKSNEKRVVVDHLDRIVQQSEYADWTLLAEPSNHKTPNDFKDFDFSFANSFNNEIEYEGLEVDTIADLPAPAMADENKIYLVKAKNAYYQLVNMWDDYLRVGRSGTPTAELQWIFKGYADQEFVAGSDEAKAITTQFSIPQLLDVYQVQVTVNIRDNGSGNIRLEFSLPEERGEAYLRGVSTRIYRQRTNTTTIGAPRTSRQIVQQAATVTEPEDYNDFSRLFNCYPYKNLFDYTQGTKVNFHNAQGELEPTYYSITAQSTDVNNFWIDTDKPYTANQDNVPVLFNIGIDAIPEFEGGETGLMHGKDATENGAVTTEPYYAAAPSAYDVGNNQMPGYALRFEGEKGLLQNVWQPVRTWAAQTWQRKQRFRLNFAKLHQFDRRKPIRVRNTHYLVKEIRTKLKMDGTISPAEVHMRKL